MKFEEQMESGPSFAKKFIERVTQEFDSVDNASIEFTNCPDMRIRKIINKGKLGFINSATIRWQPRKNRFLLATALSQGEVKSLGFTVDRQQPASPLPSILYLDEVIINQKSPDILKYLKYAQKHREHKGHK